MRVVEVRLDLLVAQFSRALYKAYVDSRAYKGLGFRVYKESEVKGFRVQG